MLLLPLRVVFAARIRPRPAQRLQAPRDIRPEHLQHGVHRLLAHHNDHQLNAQLHQAAAGAALLLPEAEQPIVLGRIADELALEEGHIEDGAVVVDELEQIDLQRQALVELRLRAPVFAVGERHRQIVVRVVQHGDDGQIDEGRRRRQHDHVVRVRELAAGVQHARVNQRHAIDDDAEDGRDGQADLRAARESGDLCVSRLNDIE